MTYVVTRPNAAEWARKMALPLPMMAVVLPIGAVATFALTFLTLFLASGLEEPVTLHYTVAAVFAVVVPVCFVATHLRDRRREILHGMACSQMLDGYAGPTKLWTLGAQDAHRAVINAIWHEVVKVPGLWRLFPPPMAVELNRISNCDEIRQLRHRLRVWLEDPAGADQMYNKPQAAR